MESYICENVFVPIRSGPSHKTEMLSQILFGEKYSIIDVSGSWIKIETSFDKFRGWIDRDHQQDTLINGNPCGNVLKKSMVLLKPDNTRIVLEPGSEIYNADFEDKIFSIGKNVYKAPSDFNKSYITLSESIADTALKFINSPYIWGGRIPSGIDCSGLSQLVYKLHGINLPRFSYMQAEIGKTIDFIDNAEAGDLLFFDDERGTINHVGVLLSKGLVIHAAGRVRIDMTDHQGIYNPENKSYTHRLRMIKRVI